MGQSGSLQSCWSMLTYAELAVQACLSQDMGGTVLPRLSESPWLGFLTWESMSTSLSLGESRKEAGV